MNIEQAKIVYYSDEIWGQHWEMIAGLVGFIRVLWAFDLHLP